MRKQPFGNNKERETKEIELFLREYNNIEPGGPWVVSSHQDRPDFKIVGTTLSEERLVELTSVYLDDTSVIRDHVRRVTGPIPIPHEAHRVERYKNRIVRSIKKKCHSFQRSFGPHGAILSLYLNEYIAIHLDEEDLLELLFVHLPRVAGNGPFKQIVLWGGCLHSPAIYYRDRYQAPATGTP
jgi:hypothetical protein